MQFSNFSVAKKMWALMLFVIVALLAAGMGMTSYMKGLEKTLREGVQDMDERIRIVVELRSNIESAASFLVAANLVEDADNAQFLNAKFQDAARRTPELMRAIEMRLQSQEGRALFAKIEQTRQNINAAAERITEQRRHQGDVSSAVRSTLLPLMQTYLQQLNELVALQERLRDQRLVEGDAHRDQAFLLGSIALALAVLFGLAVTAWLVRQFTAPLSRAVTLAQAIAAGDLTHNVHDDRQDELGHLLRSLNVMTQKLRTVVSDVRNGVESVSAAASQIASGNQDLSSRTEQTAANLQQTAASIEELTSTVSQSADTARQANLLAGTAAQAAQEGGEVVHQVVMSMDQINTSSRKISDIIGVIDGIAFQTNILALNAAVEAARAGEQGRGFAVVAGEVRNLAGRSAEAAKEIKQLIHTSVANVDMGAQQVAQAGETMQKIVDSVHRVTDLIAEISASSQEQRDGIAQVNTAVSNLDQMTQQNAALVEESSAAAASMNDQAQRLAQVVARFNVGSDVRNNFAPRAAAAPVKLRASAQAVTVSQPALKKPAPPVPSISAPASTPAPAPVQPLRTPAALSSDKTPACAASEEDWETF